METTIREWLLSTSDRLRKAGVVSPDLEAQLLAAHSLKVTRSWLFAHPDDDFPLNGGEESLSRRLLHEPLAYILGYREFYGRDFRVSPSVLIPRQDTETLVDHCLSYVRSLGASNLSILDIGTGSGCIAITLKLEVPNLEVTASDISGDALSVAIENAKLLGADIKFLSSDLFEDLSDVAFDVIVSNPPYIGHHEKLDREVEAFEPPSALFASDDGLEIYRRLANQASNYLTSDGQIMLEVGYQQSLKVIQIFQNKGWIHLSTQQDLSGIPRVVAFERAKTAEDDS